MKTYDEKKIAFIVCTNDEQYLNECLLYISLLEVPEGFETELLTITDAKSMTAGYNEGMNASDAKYKIYLHQDTFITEKRLLPKIIEIFQSDCQIGLIGLVGSEQLPKDAVMWHGKRCGDFYRLKELSAVRETGIGKILNGYREVEVVDGLFMATQYDIPWREDILKGWDFYDVSQCLEFKRAGYKVIVPAQNPAWVIHACGMPSFWHYNKNREIIIQEYKEINKNNKLRILFIHSNGIRLAGLLGAFMDLGHDVTEFHYRVQIDCANPYEEEIVEEALEEGNYDLVVTYDFSETVSNACQREGVKYYSWVYDSPLLSLYTEAAKNDINYISVFDKMQYERLQDEGYAHLKYFPLATEVNLFGAANITEEDEREYSAEVSFVGSLYEKRGFEEMFADASKEIMDEIDRLIYEDHCLWEGKTILFNKASDELINYMISKEDANYFEKYNIDKRYFCESMKLVRKRNERERITILNEIAKKFQLTLYTRNEEQEELKNVKIKGWVNYLLVMPKVFYLSKINLNITSRSIESGIPQRVWDILAVGGFCLTNYQPELEEYFEIGKDLDVFHNLDELIQKIDYYLHHEKERLQIALNGYKKVRSLHSYEMRMKDVLKWIFEE